MEASAKHSLKLQLHSQHLQARRAQQVLVNAFGSPPTRLFQHVQTASVVSAPSVDQRRGGVRGSYRGGVQGPGGKGGYVERRGTRFGVGGCREKGGGAGLG